MSNLNSINLQGNLVADPQAFGQDNSVVRFTIAVNTGYGEFKDTCFVDCVAFKKQGEIIMQHLTKGKQVIVCGELNQSRWEDKTTGDKRSKLEVKLNHINGFFFVGNGQKPDDASEPVGTTGGSGGDGEKLF